MDELASHTIWAVAVRTEFFAKFGFVQNWNISFNHHMGSSMGKWALYIL